MIIDEKYNKFNINKLPRNKYNRGSSTAVTTQYNSLENNASNNDSYEFKPVYLWGNYFDDSQDINGTIVSSGDIEGQEFISHDNVKVAVTNDASWKPTAIEEGETGGVYARKVKCAQLKADYADIIELLSDNIRTTNLTVTGQAHFFELVIDKIKSAGGAVLLTPADGFEIEDISWTDGYLYFWWSASDEDGNGTINMWEAGDMACIRDFNKAQEGVSYNVSNRFFWYETCGHGTTTHNDTNMHYIRFDRSIIHTTGGSSLEDIIDNYEEWIGASVVMLGHSLAYDNWNSGSTVNYKYERTNAIYISAYNGLDDDLVAPFFATYTGIGKWEGFDPDAPAHSATQPIYDLTPFKYSWFAGGSRTPNIPANRIQGDLVMQNGNGVLSTITDLANYTTTNINNISGSVNNLSGSVAGLEVDVSGISAYAASVSGTLSQLSGSISSITGSIDDIYGQLQLITGAITGDFSSLIDMIDNVSGTVSTLSTDVANLWVKSDNIGAALTGTETTVVTLSGTVNTMNDTVNDLGVSVNNLNGTVLIQGTTINNMSNVLNMTQTGTSNTITSINENITQISGTVNSLSGTVDSFSGTYATKTWTQTQIEASASDLNVTIMGVSGSVSSLSGTVDDLGDIVYDVSGSMSQISADVNSLSLNVSNISGTMNSLSGSVDNLVTGLNYTGIDITLGQIVMTSQNGIYIKRNQADPLTGSAIQIVPQNIGSLASNWSVDPITKIGLDGFWSGKYDSYIWAGTDLHRLAAITGSGQTTKNFFLEVSPRGILRSDYCENWNGKILSSITGNGTTVDDWGDIGSTLQVKRITPQTDNETHVLTRNDGFVVVDLSEPSWDVYLELPIPSEAIGHRVFIKTIQSQSVYGCHVKTHDEAYRIYYSDSNNYTGSLHIWQRAYSFISDGVNWYAFNCTSKDENTAP